jgi:tripartite-type tricarboxylate transporter receptor subunit TctC
MKSLKAIVVGALLVASTSTMAQSAFPDRPVSLLVPFGPGGSTDLIARALAVEMAKTLKQQVVVLNKAGAGGAIGAAEVANAKADGHMLGMLPVGPLTTQPNLRKLPYSADSFDYVCRVYANPQVLLVRKDSPYKSVMDLIADARANPGKLTYASTGTGSVPHLALAALASATGTKMVHVPYKGDSDSLLGILSGDITMFVSHSTLLSTHGDKVRGLAVLAPTRLKEFPDLPTIAEQGGPALNFEVWGGVTTAKGTPAAALAALDQACRAATQSEGFRKQLETMNTPVHYMDGKTFGAFVKSEFERNGRLLREAGIEKE